VKKVHVCPVAIGNPERQVHKAPHRGSKQQQRSCVAISLTIACSRYIYSGVILRAHPARGESHNQRNTTGEVATVPQRQALQVMTLNLTFHLVSPS